VPRASQHATLGYVDAYVMHRALDDVADRLLDGDRSKDPAKA